MQRLFFYAFFSLLSLGSLLCADGVRPNPTKKQSTSPITGELSVGLDSFRSLPEGSWEGNMGAFTSLNLRGDLSHDWYIQAGGSFGIYDWSGRMSTPFKNEKAVQQQAFFTGAISRATRLPSRLQAGIAYDWMFNRHLGEFALDPMVSQVRAQLGYLFRGGNELGLWGTIDALTAHKNYNYLKLKFRAVSQANLFWCHYFKNQAYTLLWGGIPYRRGLMYDSDRPGSYLLGARFEAPLTRSLSISGHGSYMGATYTIKGVEARNYAANVSFALNYRFCAGRKAPTPYMTLADNSNFVMDTNYNY